MDPDFRSGSALKASPPVARRESHLLLCSYAALDGLAVASFDVSTAFLKGGEFGRVVFLVPPHVAGAGDRL